MNDTLDLFLENALAASLETIPSLLVDATALLQQEGKLSTPYVSNTISSERTADWIFGVEAKSLCKEAYWDYTDACWHATRVKCSVGKPLDGIGKLFDWLDVVDDGIGLKPLITSYPERPGDDEDSIIEDVMPRGTTINFQRASYVASIARLAQALGRSMSEAGNVRHGLHMHLCAILIFSRLRSNVPVPTDAIVTEKEFRSMYITAVNQILRYLPEYVDVAVELATKLVAIHEVAIADAVFEAQDEGASMGSPAFVEPQGHFAAQECLARALGSFGDQEGAYQAYIRAIELMEIDWPFAQSGKKIKVTPKTLRSIFADLTTYGMSLQKPSNECVAHARAAVKVTRQMENATANRVGNEAVVIEDAKVFLAAGTLAYAYAVDLAGGPETASSPPIGIGTIAAAKSTGTAEPCIKGLLNEAVEYLEDALDRAPADGADGDTISKRIVALQLAIVSLERREETRCQMLLSTYNLTRSLLTELESRRTRELSSPQVLPFVGIFYSIAVLKQILSLAPCDQQERVASRRFTLSRRSRSNLRVQCTYCCMNSSSEPLKCESCAESGVMVWYCTEECMHSHHVQHKEECAKRLSWRSNGISAGMMYMRL